jgi:hypothetical protein
MIQGKLQKTENGRYAIYHELTSGDVVEVFFNGEWARTSVEFVHSKGDYCLMNGVPIDGAMVRIGAEK